jgi:hypothetical protein
MAYNPARDTRNWYTRLMFAQHLANLVPVWGRSTEPAIRVSPCSIVAARH